MYMHVYVIENDTMHTAMFFGSFQLSRFHHETHTICHMHLHFLCCSQSITLTLYCCMSHSTNISHKPTSFSMTSGTLELNIMSNIVQLHVFLSLIYSVCKAGTSLIIVLYSYMYLYSLSWFVSSLPSCGLVSCIFLTLYMCSRTYK